MYCVHLFPFFLENPEDQYCVKFKNVLKKKIIAGYRAQEGCLQQDQSEPDLGSTSAEGPKDGGPSADVIALRIEVKEYCMLYVDYFLNN